VILSPPYFVMLNVIRSLILTLLTSISGFSFAHDPGLSFVDLSISNKNIEAHLVFAKNDLESLVVINADKDGKINTHSGLASIAKEALKITQGEQLLEVDLVSLSVSEKDGLHIRLKYLLTSNEKLTINAVLIPSLARGHRQYISILNEEKLMIGETILSAESQQLEVDYNPRTHLDTVIKFLGEGVHHIWIGIDHILFLLTLLLPAVLVFNSNHWSSVASFKDALISTIKIVTAFTLAHSITLSLAVLNIVYIPSYLVESVIAFSVILTAFNNLYPVFTSSRWLLAFIFGLIHGFGFAGVLIELGLPENRLGASLLGFNLGVEAGQIMIVGLLLPILYLMREANYYRLVILRGGSIAALLIASIWLFERSLNVQIIGM